MGVSLVVPLVQYQGTSGRKSPCIFAVSARSCAMIYPLSMDTPVSADAPDWVAPGLAQLFVTVLDAAERGALSAEERHRFRSAGAAAADAGASLSTLIDAYLRGAGELWEHLFTDTRGTGPTVELGRTLRQISERAVASLAAGFEDAQRRNIRVEENARRELIDLALRSGPVDDAAFDRQAALLGFDRAETHRVAVLVPAGRVEPVAFDRAQVSLQRHLGFRAGGAAWIVGERGNHLVVIGPGTRTADLKSLPDEVHDQWWVGIGEAHEGVEGIQASYAEALDAVRLAERFSLDHVADYGTMLLERMLSADRTVVERLDERVLAPLTRASRGALLETLAAFVDANGNTAEAARRLSVGTRTVGYRLDRIAALTGLSPRDPDGRLTLELALRCRPLVDAPPG
jgi:hypothetical protein